MKTMKSILMWSSAGAAVATVASAQRLQIQGHRGSPEHGSRSMDQTYDDSGMSGDSGAELAGTTDKHSNGAPDNPLGAISDTFGVLQPATQGGEVYHAGHSGEVLEQDT